MKKSLLFGLMVFFVALFSFSGGVFFSKKDIGITLDITQAELAFNHLKRYQAIKSDLEMGCAEEALEKLTFSIDEQMMLLAEYVQYHKADAINTYIARRDEHLLEQLKSYSINWKKTWVEKDCQKNG